MILDDSRCIHCGELDDIGLGVSKVIRRSGEPRAKQGFIAQAFCPTMLDKLPIMDGQDQSLLDPDRFFHLDKTCSVFL